MSQAKKSLYPVPDGHTYLCRLAAAKARFDNRHSTSAPTPTLAVVSGSGAGGTSSPPNRQCYPLHFMRECIPPNLHDPQRAKESLDRRSKRLSFPHFFLRRKKCGRRRPPPRQGKPTRRRSGETPPTRQKKTPLPWLGQAVAEASAPVNAGTVLLTDSDDRCTPPASTHRQIYTCPPRAKGSLDRRSKRLSFPHFFLRRKKCGRRRPSPRQGETDSPPQRRNPPRAKGSLNRRFEWFSLVTFF